MGRVLTQARPELRSNPIAKSVQNVQRGTWERSHTFLGYVYIDGMKQKGLLDYFLPCQDGEEKRNALVRLELAAAMVRLLVGELLTTVAGFRDAIRRCDSDKKKGRWDGMAVAMAMVFFTLLPLDLILSADFLLFDLTVGGG